MWIRDHAAVLFAFAVASSACDQGRLDTPSVKPAPNPDVVRVPSLPDATLDTDLRPPVAADLADYERELPGDGGPLRATIETTMGTFHCELYGDKAPMTVANFIGLATGLKAWRNPETGMIERGKPFFDGLIFHRVIPGFMIQGGDPLGRGVGGPGYTFNDEIWDGAHHGPGTLAMANAGTRAGEGTNGSQFFIMEGDAAHLDSRHTVFGTCAERELVKKIASVRRDHSDKPLQPITMTRVTVRYGDALSQIGRR